MTLHNCNILLLCCAFLFSGCKKGSLSEKSFQALIVKPKVIDLGDVTQNTKTPFQFTLSNSNNFELLLQKVEASCGCTGLDTVPTKVPAHGSITITGMLSSKGQNGDFGSSITIFYKTPDSEPIHTVKFNVGATSLVAALASETFLNFGTVDFESQKSLASVIVSKASPKVEWKDIEVQSGSLEHKITHIEDGKWKIDFYFDPKIYATVGLVKERMTVNFFDSNHVPLAHHSLKILTQAKILVPGVEVSPPSLYLAFLKEGENSKKTIQIDLKTGWLIEKSKISMSQPDGKNRIAVVTDVVENSDGALVNCLVTGKKQGDIEAVLLIPIHHKSAPSKTFEIRVPFIGVVSR